MHWLNLSSGTSILFIVFVFSVVVIPRMQPIFWPICLQRLDIIFKSANASLLPASVNGKKVYFVT